MKFILSDEIYDILRNLAKKPYYQSLYSQAKELGLKIFENDINFTSYQIVFLNYICMYNNLSLDVYLGEVDEIVMDNFIYEDAYLLYKRENRKKESAKSQVNKNKKKKDSSDTGSLSSFSWNFRAKKT
jgi:hypothetical protein